MIRIHLSNHSLVAADYLEGSFRLQRLRSIRVIVSLADIYLLSHPPNSMIAASEHLPDRPVPPSPRLRSSSLKSIERGTRRCGTWRGCNAPISLLSRRLRLHVVSSLSHMHLLDDFSDREVLGSLCVRCGSAGWAGPPAVVEGRARRTPPPFGHHQLALNHLHPRTTTVLLLHDSFPGRPYSQTLDNSSSHSTLSSIIMAGWLNLDSGRFGSGGATGASIPGVADLNVTPVSQQSSLFTRRDGL